jgi:transcriptional regulator with XRE-family HTH domain
LNNRIKELRKALKLSQEAFAARIGLKGSSLSLIESGHRNITNQNIISICREFGVNEEWLRTGDGSMYLKKSRAEQAADIVKKTLNTDDEFILNTFIALGQLSPAEWNMVKNFVDKIKGDDKSGNNRNKVKLNPADVDIDAETAGYRQQLEAQKKAADESSAMNGGLGIG